MGRKEIRHESTLRLPAAGKAPRSLREKMILQTSHQRGREGAARKRILMTKPVFDSTRMSPQPLNADEEAVNFELFASGNILIGNTLAEQPIDHADPIVATDLSYDPSDHNPMSENRSVLENETEIKLSQSRNPRAPIQEPEDSLGDDV